MRQILSSLLFTAAVSLSCFATIASASNFQKGTMAVEGRVGAGVPLGDFSDDYSSSFTLGGSFLYGLSNVLALEGNANYNTNFSCAYNNCDSDIFELTGGVRYLFPTNNVVVPYLGGGGGLYHIGGDNTDDDDFGLNYGGGILINLRPKLAVDLGARFNTIFETDDSETYLNLTGGIVYFFSS